MKESIKKEDPVEKKEKDIAKEKIQDIKDKAKSSNSELGKEESDNHVFSLQPKETEANTKPVGIKSKSERPGSNYTRRKKDGDKGTKSKISSRDPTPKPNEASKIKAKDTEVESQIKD